MRQDPKQLSPRFTVVPHRNEAGPDTSPRFMVMPHRSAAGPDTSPLPERGADLAAALRHPTTMLVECEWDASDARCLRILDALPLLEELYLEEGVARDEDIPLLARAAARSHTLTILRVHSARPGAAALRAWGELLAGAAALETFDLVAMRTHPRRTVPLTRAAFAPLARGIAAGAALTTLTLRALALTPAAVRALAAALGSHATLRKVRLVEIPLDAEGAAALAAAPGPGSALVNLCLRSCDLDDACVYHIAEALAAADALDVLKLPDNYIGAEGARYLGAALHLTRKLDTLVLENNPGIGTEGVRHLVDALHVNATLGTLRVGADHNLLGFNGPDDPRRTYRGITVPIARGAAVTPQ